MKIFISWSGARSQSLAIILRDWIGLIFGTVEPWMSKEDIEVGSRWSPTIADQLNKTDFGIICLTPENLDAPWIHFEAGALSKSVGDAKVIPLLFDLDVTQFPSSNPLSSFQAVRCDKEGLLRILKAINGVCEENRDDEKIEELFRLAFPDLDKRIADIPPASGPTPVTHRNTNDILEELVGDVRSLDMRLGSLARSFHNQSTLLGNVVTTVASPSILTRPSLIGSAIGKGFGLRPDTQQSEEQEGLNRSENDRFPWEKYEKSDPRQDDSET